MIDTGIKEINKLKTFETAHDEEAFVEAFPAMLATTNLKGVYTVQPSSHDIDLNSATPEELIKNGFFWGRPAASHSPALVKAWQRISSHKWLSKDRIVPQLKSRVGKTHNLRRPLRQMDDGTYVSYQWAGAGFQGLGPWNAIIGIWEIPTVTQPSEQQGEEKGWDSSSWVGIDGFQDGRLVSNDVLQAGVEQAVDSGGNASYIAWFEWFAPKQTGSPSYVDQTNVIGFEVNAGQQVLCFVVFYPFFVPFATAVGIITFLNETTGHWFMVLLLPPPGATASGNTAEWIMEAPDGGEPKSSLPKFTPVVFSLAVANGALGQGDPQFGSTTNIESQSNQLLTSVTVGSDTVRIDFIG